MNTVKSWYLGNYSSDTLGNKIKANLTFDKLYDLMNNGVDFYTAIGVSDSVIRERVFKELANKYCNGDYNQIYNLWFLG